MFRVISTRFGKLLQVNVGKKYFFYYDLNPILATLRKVKRGEFEFTWLHRDGKLYHFKVCLKNRVLVWIDVRAHEERWETLELFKKYPVSFIPSSHRDYSPTGLMFSAYERTYLKYFHRFSTMRDV